MLQVFLTFLKESSLTILNHESHFILREELYRNNTGLTVRGPEFKFQLLLISRGPLAKSLNFHAPYFSSYSK